MTMMMMRDDGEEEYGITRWGTWEELLLGGAVLRHGTRSWDAVSAELRARSSSFTPLECQAKYEDIQQHYSGCKCKCNAWFEELRNRRVAVLKRELEKSEDSIGSLQSKLESLTSGKETGCNFEYNAINTESTSLLEDADAIDPCAKEGSRDESSAGSFTEKSVNDWTHKCQANASFSVQGNDLKMPCPEDFPKEKFGCGCVGIGFVFVKKKRGKRKRKGCNLVKECSVGVSDTLSSAAFLNSEESAGVCTQDLKPNSEDSCGTRMGEGDAHLDLAKIMDLIMKHQDVSIFRCRLESQKRARYKKMIRRHVDFRNIRSRISNGSISSAKELLRDLLLLCNSALIFFPKSSTEHKSALVLRDIVNKALRQRFNSQSPARSCRDDENAAPKKIVKSRKIRSAPKHPVAKNAAVDADAAPPKEEKAAVPPRVGGTSLGGKGNNGACADAAFVKRGIGRPAKGGQRVGGRRKESPSKGWKRART